MLTRRDMVELAASVIGARNPKIRHVPAAIFSVAALGARPFNRRVSELLEFAAKVATTDCVAPTMGSQHLADYFHHEAQAR